MRIAELVNSSRNMCLRRAGGFVFLMENRCKVWFFFRLKRVCALRDLFPCSSSKPPQRDDKHTRHKTLYFLCTYTEWWWCACVCLFVLFVYYYLNQLIRNAFPCIPRPIVTWNLKYWFSIMRLTILLYNIRNEAAAANDDGRGGVCVVALIRIGIRIACVTIYRKAEPNRNAYIPLQYNNNNCITIN